MKMIRKIRNDDKIKAVVLRVNSPGGSAKASDNILRELNLVKEAGKPVVVSMGNVAASGGYYISCQADKIYAEKNTITGSIGVYSMLPILENFMEKKLGINYDSVSTGKHSLGINPFFDSSEEVAQTLQDYTDKVYDQFLSRVAKGRDMTKDAVHEVAQGRVWTGGSAVENGLIDDLGSLENAIESAADLAGLDEYRLTNYPRLKEPFEQLLDEIMNPDSKVKSALQAELGDFYTHFEQFRRIREMRGDFMMMPYVFEFQ
jgi:protease-4